ncbi:formylglycine-generating enzyme family protein [Oceaniglobus ichthyenteri]|uniref:formylglycine-generating enzyme family protein n=1 Tax=Oceaniglobus ichthyenteri TaxID=2136177 RepID=UPI000D334AC7|nr:formylglycine-generating enzyme family protein [Oceaniglobus ichthyenteri]
MTDTARCCSPEMVKPTLPDQTLPTGGNVARDCVPVPGGRAVLGTDRPVFPVDEEGPARRATVKPLWWERGTVSNAAFARFVDATGYQTEAERFGWSFVFWSHVPEQQGPTHAVQGVEWWRRVDGACWHRPTGPQGGAPLADHPVVHIAWTDARAYAAWVGGRLPREAEWEHAARGGLGDVRYPWGHEAPTDAGPFRCNIWQGRFPDHDTGADGFTGTAPTHSFPANGYGLFNMVGNIWEWSSDPFRLRTLKRAARQVANAPRKLLKGGSFLCHESYCHRYRIAARIGNTPDSTTTHTGFRVVYDTPPLKPDP